MIPITSYLVFALAALGLLLTWRKWRHLLFIYLLILLDIVQSLYFYGSSRFRAPIEPLLIILAAGTIWWLSQRWAIRHLSVATVQEPRITTAVSTQ